MNDISRGKSSLDANMKNKIDAEPVVSQEAEQILATVLQAKKDLSAWVNSKDNVEKYKAFEKLGMNEGLYTALSLAAMDEDGDNRISPEEVQHFNDESAKVIDSHLNSFANGGIISALIFSIIFPITYTLEVNEGDGALEHLEFICMQLSVCGSLTAISTAAMMYTQLAFFIPTLKLKLWYIDKVRFFLPILEALKNTSLILLASAQFFRQMYQTYFPLNLISILPMILSLWALIYFFGYVLHFQVTPRLFLYAKDLVANQEAIGVVTQGNPLRGHGK